MSTPYTPVATYHNQINVTVDGDLANAGEFNPPYQECADNAAFCKAAIDPLISGGTISPSGPLIIAAEVSVNALHVTAGNATFAADAVATGSFVSTAGNIVASAGDISASGDATIGGTVGAGAVNADGDIQTVSGSLATAGASIAPSGNINTAGSLSVAGATSLLGAITDPLNFTSLGRARMRSVRGTDFAAVTYAAYFNLIFWPNMATTNRTAIIDAGGGQGDWMFCSIDATTNSLTVNFPGGATVTFAPSANPQTALFAYIGTQWFGPLFKA